MSARARSVAFLLACWATTAVAGPPPLAAPNLSVPVFRDGMSVVSAESIHVIGFGPAGAIYVSGAFTSVDGNSRPHGVARLHADGTLDLAWAPAIPSTATGPVLAKLAAESAGGAVALVISDPDPNVMDALVVVPHGAASGTTLLTTSQPEGRVVSALAFDPDGALYAAVGRQQQHPGPGLPARIRKFSAGGVPDLAFDLSLSGSYNNCPFPHFPVAYVHALVAAGGHLYVGGDFRSQHNPRISGNIGGAVRASLATGDVDLDWAPMNAPAFVHAAGAEKLTCVPAPTGIVTSIAVGSGVVYLAGPFDLPLRKRLARFLRNAPASLDAAWTPDAPSDIRSIALDEARGFVYLGGGFSEAGGTGRAGLAAYSTTAGGALVATWDPSAPPRVTHLHLAADRLLAGGAFAKVGGADRIHAAAVPLASDPVAWPVISVAPRSLDFGAVLAPIPRQRTTTVTNAGTGSLTVGPIALAGDPSLSREDTCAAPLAAGESCTITVTAPMQRGRDFSASLTIGAGGLSPQPVALAAGFGSAYTLDGNASHRVTLETTLVGETRGRDFLVANMGATALAIEGVDLVGPAGEVAARNECPATLAPRATCRVGLTFAPTTYGERSASLRLAASASGAHVSISLPSGLFADDYDGDGLSNSRDTWPFVKSNDLFSYPFLFVPQQYRDFLGREGDDHGIRYWTSRMHGCSTMGCILPLLSHAQLIESFFDSQEFQGTIAPVARLYFAYFLRVPDYGGITFWSQYYRSHSLLAISNFFAASPEFRDRYGSLGNGEFVTLVYQNVLGRAPDPGGHAFWTQQLDSGSMTRGQVMLGFSESPEYRALTRNEVYVTMMYVGMLRRASDPGGFSFWVDYMDRGNPGLALIEQFFSSAEYRARFLP